MWALFYFFMDISILSKELPYLLSLKDKNIQALALDKNFTKHRHKDWLLLQLQARQKAKNKLPTWCSNWAIIFPTLVSVEQASSEKTAAYKADLVSGNVLDGSGGMGVDSYYFAKRCVKVDCLEVDFFLTQIVDYNKDVFQLSNLTVHTTSLEGFLESNTKVYDWIYVDPSRRESDNKRIVDLEACSPNVVELLPMLKRSTQKVLVKVAPLLDISLAIKQLQYVSCVYVVQWKQEVRELLFVLDFSVEKVSNVPIRCVSMEGQAILLHTSSGGTIVYDGVKNYLYIPAPALMKSQDFGGIGQYYGVDKIAPHTHLYTSKEWVSDFFGIGLKVLHVSNWKGIRDILVQNKIEKVNIIIKNAPLLNVDVCKKLRIKEGGELFLIVYKNNANGIEVVVGEKG